MSDQLPVLVWVPGSFSPPDIHYPHLISSFTSRGYTLIPIELPTTTKKPGPPPSMHDDAAHIKAVLTRLAEEGKEIVLAGHSYGGTPMSEALKGLSKAERTRLGKKGGVVRAGYVAALVPAVGNGAGSLMGDVPMDYTTLDEDGWLHHLDPEQSAQFCFSNVEEGVEWIKKFTQHSARSFVDELTYAGYKEVPVSWLLTENDNVVLPQIQQVGISIIEDASGQNVDVTRIPFGHMPHIDAPEFVVDWMVHLVGKGDQE